VTTPDLIVIGSSGAAMAAGIAARSEGRRVLLVERALVDGTRLNVGCVPSKTLLTASGQREHALRSGFRGVPTSAAPVDLGATVQQKADLVDHLRRVKYLDVADAHGFEIRHGEARFADEGTLLVDGDLVTARSAPSRWSR
jgi:mercuric reductase